MASNPLGPHRPAQQSVWLGLGGAQVARLQQLFLSASRLKELADFLPELLDL